MSEATSETSHGIRRVYLALLILFLFVQNRSFAQTGPEASVIGLTPATYEIITLRKASDVAAVAEPTMETDSPIGETISFTARGLSLDGLGCDHWEISQPATSVVNLDDPMLADINIGPLDGPVSAGDQRVLRSYAYACEGEPFIQVLQVDDRVIVIPWENSSSYLIAEKPLSTEQIGQLQKELKSMKFLSAEITGVMDESTRFALGLWVNYRARLADGYNFHRPAITENLLDGLGVLDANNEELTEPATAQ